MPALQDSINAVRVAAEAADRIKATDIVAFDVADLLGITDIMMIAGASNERQVLAVAELAERYPEDFRSWMESRGGELKYGAEPKEAVGKRGVEALEDWSTRAGDDTDLFVFSHGAWIAQTLQTLLGISAIDPTFSTVVSLRNAHWVRLVPMDNPDGTVRWRLLDYNHGPAIADTDEWERER